MTIYLSLAIAGAAWFSLCLGILLSKFGIPPSLSESYYNLGGKDGKGYLFYIMLLVTVFLMITPMVQAAGGWGFLCGLGLLFVGAAPAFKGDSGIDKILHPVGAIACAASAALILIHIGEWGWLVASAFFAWGIAYATMTMRQCYIFWLEMAAFYGLFAGVIVHFLKV